MAVQVTGNTTEDITKDTRGVYVLALNSSSRKTPCGCAQASLDRTILLVVKFSSQLHVDLASPAGEVSHGT